MDSAAAGHIVRHDPARVLAEVAAKRRIIDEMVPVIDDLEEIATSEGQAARHPTRPGEYLNQNRDPALYLLRLLALPYADRPGYREEWRL